LPLLKSMPFSLANFRILSKAACPSFVKSILNL
jgi:hypothetical protein